MPDETQVLDAPALAESESPAQPSPQSGDQTPLSEEAAALGEGESEATPPGKSWDEFRAESIDSNEEYKAALEGSHSAEYFRGRDEAMAQAPEVQQYNINLKQVEGQYRKAVAEVPLIANAIQEAVATDNWDSLSEVFRKNPNAWQAVQALSDSQQNGAAAAYIDSQRPYLEPMGIDLSQPETLGQQVLVRQFAVARAAVDTIARKAGTADILKEFDSATQSGTPGHVAFEKALDDFAKHHYNRGVKLAGKADTDIDKAKARSGGGPDTTPKGAGGGNLTAEGYKQKLARGEAVTPEEVDAMTRRYLT